MDRCAAPVAGRLVTFCAPTKIQDFQGHWTLRREIVDRLAARRGWLEGEAVFAPDAEGLKYTERGLLRFDGQGAMTAERCYLWRGVPGGVAVQFGDGAAFHAFALGDGGAAAAHWCDPDQYEVVYDFQDWPRWRNTWDVRGPHKDYCMVSVYEPRAKGPVAP